MTNRPTTRRGRRERTAAGAVGQATVHKVYCPCCGMLRSPYWTGRDGQRHFTWNLSRADRRKFGEVMSIGGRGGLRVLGPLDPVDDPYLHDQVKHQLLMGLRFYIERGWLDPADAQAAIAGAAP